MIRVQDLSFRLGEFQLDKVNLSVERGEYCVLLGPTGSGKTILLECLAGIHRPERGNIFLDEQEVSERLPEERGIGYVPQDYALFPNMKVEENIAFGLRARGRDRQEIRARCDSLLEILGLQSLRGRDPRTLSGGEQQRVALGRALAVEPSILLLDEPLSALDEHLRWEMGARLRDIQQQFGTTFLHVCHNFEEAAQVGDRIAIMNAGRIQQVGRLDEILNVPANAFVARFTQSRNLLPATAETRGKACHLRLAEGVDLLSTQKEEGPVLAVVRPERILWPAAEETTDNILRGSVLRVQNRFAWSEMHLELAHGLALVLSVSARLRESIPEPGNEVQVRIPPEAIALLPVKDETS